MYEMPISFSIEIQIAVALTFVVMWFEGRRQSCLLWWMVGHLCTALMLGLTSQLASFEQNVPFLFSLFFNIVLAFNTTAYFLAASHYAKLPVLTKYFLYGTPIYALVLLAVAFYLDQRYARISALVSMSMAFLFTAWSLWGKSLLVRITALFFVFRAFSLFDFIVLSGGLEHTALVTNSIFMIPLISVLLLLLTIFHDFQEELKKHINFLSLTQSFSRAMEGVAEIKEASERLITLLLERQVWRSAGVLIPDSDSERLYLVTATGAYYTQGLLDLMASEGLPFVGSMSGKALLSKEIVCSHDVYNDGSIDIARIGKYLKNINEKVTQVAVPLQHDQTVYGVLIASRITSGQITAEEMKILENIGQVMGLTLANIQHMDALSYSASHDALTKLSNRPALHNFLKSQQVGKRFVLMLFDLNHFKEVNDTLGHSVGDSMLCALAQRLETQLASESIHIYRLGGDEFVVNYEMTPNRPPKEQLAKQLSKLIAEVIYIDDLALRTTASIGVVDSEGRALNSHELLRCADLAMYQAKSQGVAIAYYEKETDNEVQRRVSIIEGIAQAIERGQLELAYQPIIDLGQSQCHKCEALIRWRHPEDGLIAAAKFMPIIETTHMISAITRIVAQKAIAAVKAWQGVVVSINLSARNLLDEKLVDFLLAEVAKQELNPALIQFEITETMLMADHKAAELVLNRLVAAGFTIALDDFGTGYSSLAYLSHFPIHTLKIDGSFIRKMSSDSGTRSIVESTIELCHKLGLDVVAEGVEACEDARALGQMGCHFAQGYLYAKPLSEADFNDWLNTFNSVVSQ